MFQFVCNDYTSDPEVIADLYKRRWQIETLFKRIKQRYPLKYF
ncbi:MAG: transposase [Bacteroidetes bacterium]|nr:transposase [Bacteroidota bacterium]